TRIAGVEEIKTTLDRSTPQGTVNYTAPEYLEGERGSNRSDIFSLGVIAYEMLTGKLPYGDAETPRPAHKLRYTPARQWRKEIPVWVDGALEKALQPRPAKRYDLLSEFLHDLSHPNSAFLEKSSQPLIERNPVAFWRGLALLLLTGNLVLLYLLARA
ncbi:MAG TPA: bifunctional protein-serine/threonine kinase/phosphatase, partial [Sedimenticola sp.]|nr:bifunctional protein-serine/threonine kinase/phosphatase [Sedimenticola sp.]